MPVILEAYGNAVIGLAPLLKGLHARLVAIDGRDGSGKTTLGRYLAWHFNCTLLETDLFLVPGQGNPKYRNDDLARIISGRLNDDSPIIVESVLALDLFDSLGMQRDYWLHITNTKHGGCEALMTKYIEYETRRKPTECADTAITVSVL